MAALVQIEGLGITFRTPRGPVEAVRGVSLSIGRGSVTGLVGESGSGKTTVATAIMCLLSPDAVVTSGRILFDGLEMFALNEAGLRDLRGSRISMIFQDPMTALNPVVSIGRQMADVQYRDGAAARVKRRRAAEMLNRVGIADPERRLDDIPQALSGGMRQRVAIAMSLLNRPDLVIADEPTTALDATLEAQVVDLLRDLQAEYGTTVLFVSHNLGLVAELSDKVAVMYLGELVEEGPVGEIFHRPAHPYTQALLRCDPARIAEPTRLLPTIAGEIADAARRPQGCVFSGRCPVELPGCAFTGPAVTQLSGGHKARCHRLAGPPS